MEKKVSPEFVSLVFCSSKGSKNLIAIVSGANNVQRAKDLCDKILSEDNYYSRYCTLRVVETALNSIVSTASYLRYEANTKKRRHLNAPYFNL